MKNGSYDGEMFVFFFFIFFFLPFSQWENDETQNNFQAKIVRIVFLTIYI